MTTREWALAYAALDWRTFPVIPGGKQPLYKGWQADATTEPEQIGRYWRQDPGPNIGAVCGEVFDAFDIESEHVPALTIVMRQGGLSLPETPVARSGRGGLHILVAPTGIGHGSDLYLNGVHVGELKSTGGFIVVAPSVTIGPYRWRFDPRSIPAAPAPAWLLGLVGRPRRLIRRFPARVLSASQGRDRLDVLARVVRAAEPGRRNNVLYWAMRRALDEGVPARYAEAALGRAAFACGLDEREIGRTICSAIDADGDAR